MPACSISQAALVLTRPSRSGHRGAPSGTTAGSTIGLVKNDPALQVSWSSGSSTMPLPRRSPSTASRTASIGARAPLSTPRVRASSAYPTGADSAPSGSWNATSTTTCRDGSALNRECRYENPQSAAATVRTAPSTRSQTRTHAIVSDTSCPYAPTFWIGVDPTRPGTPDIDSIPDHPSSIARTTSSSQSSPAATRTIAPEHASDSTRTPEVAIWTTVPSKPSSAITTLLPPDNSSTGSPAASADRTASISSASVSTVTSVRAGPPIRSVVRSASGTSYDVLAASAGAASSGATGEFTAVRRPGP